MSREKFRRFGWAVYSVIFTLAIIVALVGVFIFKTGVPYDISLNLSASLLTVALVFFLTQKLFLYDPEEPRRQELSHQLDEVSSILERVTDIFQFTDVKLSSAEGFDVLIQAYETSQKSIDVISWQNIQKQMASEQGMAYAKATANRLSKPPSIKFHWLLWTEDHLAEAQKVLEEQEGFIQADIAFFLPPNGVESPVIPCAIIDEKLVTFGWGYLGRQERDDVSIILKRPEAVNTFVDYFTYLWQESTMLKFQGEKELDRGKLNQVRQQIKSSQATSIQTEREEAFGELEKEYKTSKKSIDIISWQELQAQPVDTFKKNYFDVLGRHLQSSPKIEHRRILWRQEHLDFLDQMSEYYDNIPNAEIVFFVSPEGLETPIIPCVIVDEKIINFGWGYLGRAEMDEVNITFRQPEAVQAFTEYFAFLWQRGIILKERGQKIDKIKLADLRQNYEMPELMVQNTLEEAYRHLIKSYQSSKQSINNVSWKDLQMQTGDPLRKKYFEEMIQKVKSVPHIVLRRILWTPGHLEYLEETAEIYDDIPNVEFRYFSQLEELETPIMPCTIVDESIVDFGWEYLGSPQMDVFNITVTRKEIVDAFTRYFAYLWQKSVPLKERNRTIDRAIVEELKKKLHTN